jgi:hypothetical protein
MSSLEMLAFEQTSDHRQSQQLGSADLFAVSPMRRDRFIIDLKEVYTSFLEWGSWCCPSGRKIARRKIVVRQLHDTNAAKTLSFSSEEGLCLARVHRHNFMKDAHALSFEVEFIRQISFLRTALRSWLLARVSHLIAATRIADLYRRF